MRSPGVAVLWEIWRVTRTEVAARLALSVFGGAIALFAVAAFPSVDDPTRAREFGAVVAMVVLTMQNIMGWAFLSRLNGSKAGYPLPLLYARPIGTAKFVSLQLAYLTAVPAAIYLVAALLLRLISGYPFPLLPVAAWVSTTMLMMTALYWSTRSVFVQQIVGLFIAPPWLIYAVHRLTSYPDGYDWHDSPALWPAIFDLSLTDYALFAVLGLASFGVAIYNVARQRRGDARMAWNPGSGWPEWWVNFVRFPCPSSSATRAQVWFDLKSRGLPVLLLSLTFAILNPLLFTLSNLVDAANPTWSVPLGPMALLFAMMFVPVLMIIGGFNAFGIRWRKGGAYFEATQPYSTARLAGFKVLVAWACLLVALTTVVGSAWAFLSFFPLHTGDKLFLKMVGMPVLTWQRQIEEAIGALTGFEQLALVLVAAVGIFVWVAAFAVILPLWVRFPRRGNIAASVLLLGGLALTLLAWGGRLGFVPDLLVDLIFALTRWSALAALVISTLYLLWSSLSERLLTLRWLGVALVVTTAIGTAWLTVLHAGGVRLDGMPVTSAAALLSLALPPLMAAVLVPWSLSRFRHL